MKTFSSKLLYYSMYQYITKVLPTIFVYYTEIQKLRILRFLISEILRFLSRNYFAADSLFANHSYDSVELVHVLEIHAYCDHCLTNFNLA